jgi:hypothetical protein
MRLKVLTGEHKDKIGIRIEVNLNSYDKNGNFQQHYQIIKFEDGTTGKFSLYNIGILENLDFKDTPTP